jgi:hypothetical protein
MPNAPEGHVVHLTPRRLRIRIPAKRHHQGFFSTVRQHLSQNSAVERVEVNPITASVLIHTPDSKAFLEGLGREGPFTIVEQLSGTAQANPIKQVRQQLSEWDKQLQEWTGIRHDARAYIFVALVLSGVYQLARGEIFAPAATLLWYAGEALRLWVPSVNAGSNAPTEAAGHEDSG